MRGSRAGGSVAIFHLALCAAALGPGGIGAESLETLRLAFLPPQFGAGEEVEAIALVSSPGREPEAFALKAGKGLPSPTGTSDPEIREVRLSKGKEGWELRVRFVPWSPENGTIPSMTVRGISLPALRYTVRSVLAPGERDLSPPKPQAEPPGTALYLYGFAGVVLLLCLIGAGTAAYVVPAARSLMARRRAAQAFRALERSLAWLERGMRERRDGRGKDGQVGESPGDFYAALARALRLYLSARVLPEAAALTPAEIATLPESRFPGPGIKDEAVSILLESDRARYAGEDPGVDAMLDAIARSSQIGRTAEEALDALL